MTFNFKMIAVSVAGLLGTSAAFAEAQPSCYPSSCRSVEDATASVNWALQDRKVNLTTPGAKRSEQLARITVEQVPAIPKPGSYHKHDCIVSAFVKDQGIPRRIDLRTVQLERGEYGFQLVRGVETVFTLSVSREYQAERAAIKGLFDICGVKPLTASQKNQRYLKTYQGASGT